MRARWLLAAGLTVALAGGVAAAPRDSASPSDLAGDWRIEPSGDPGSVQLQLHREWSGPNGHGNSSSSFDVRQRDLAGIRPDDWTADRAEVAFDLTRDAGMLHFEGTLRRGRGIGEYRFAPNERFRDELERAGFRDVQPEDMLRLALHDVDREWVRGFDGRDLRLDDLVRFKIHGVTPEFVRSLAAAGYRHLAADDLVRFRIHKVDAAFVRELGDLGDDRPTADDLVRLKLRGVEPSYVRAMSAAVSPRPSLDDVIRLHSRGVEPEYARDLKEAGFEELGADDLMRLKSRGVTPAQARRAKSRYRDVTVDDVIRLKARGEL